MTGAKNRPAVATGLGYEADKLSPVHMATYFRGYMDPIARAVGPLVGKSLRSMLIDSWEAGMQNWTEEMLPEFRRRRGYDPTPYLPVLTGRIVETAELSDRFLWDFRRTLADMFADNHYGVLAEQLEQLGMESYGEAAGVSLEILEDTLLNKSRVDIPMGEFWMRDLHPGSMYLVDVHGAASAAHAYGKPLVAAEAFTGGGFESPLALRKVADRWFAEGVNRLVFHTSAHQPLDTKPGNTMVGTHLNRNITWAEQAGPFMTCLARTSFLLQQGLAVADIAYLLNEGAPSTMPFWGSGVQPAPPAGYRYDYVNADVVVRRMSVDEDGKLALPDGMSYRVLVLPQIDTMTLPLLRKIRDLVSGGATVVGPPPRKAPGLSGHPENDRDVQALASDLWGDLDGISRTRRVYGKGRVVWGQPLSAVLDLLRAPPDFESSGSLDSAVTWTHRRAGLADIYFVANPGTGPVDLTARFRVGGKEAEIWRPDSGAIEPADYAVVDGRITVPLRLAEGESVFVVFRRPAASPARAQPRGLRETRATLGGPWELSFPPKLGAPPRIRVDRLESWTASADEGVRFFSGTATYTRSFQAPAAWLRSNARLLIDLGTVRESGRGVAQRPDAGDPLEAAVRGGRHRRVEAGRESAGDQSDEPVDEPAGRRSGAARRAQDSLPDHCPRRRAERTAARRPDRTGDAGVGRGTTLTTEAASCPTLAPSPVTCWPPSPSSPPAPSQSPSRNRSRLRSSRGSRSTTTRRSREPTCSRTRWYWPTARPFATPGPGPRSAALRFCACSRRTSSAAARGVPRGCLSTSGTRAHRPSTVRRHAAR